MSAEETVASSAARTRGRGRRRPASRPEPKVWAHLLIRAHARINLTSGRRVCGCTNIPPAAARAQEDETILDDGVSAMPRCGRPPGSGGL